MDPLIIGTLPSRPVKSGDKFRATWALTAGKLLPGALIDADAVAHTVQEALPSLGFYTVSNPNAVPGDLAIVFDIRTTGGFAGGNVADVAQALDRLPPFAGGWATDLAKLEALPLSGISADQLAHDQEQARLDANKAAESASWTSRITDFLKTAGIVVVLAGAVVLFVVLKGKSKDWE